MRGMNQTGQICENSRKEQRSAETSKLRVTFLESIASWVVLRIRSTNELSDRDENRMMRIGRMNKEDSVADRVGGLPRSAASKLRWLVHPDVKDSLWLAVWIDRIWS